LRNLTATATNLINSESPKTSRICLTVLLVFVLLAAGLMVAMGATVTLLYPADVPAMLDGGWRIMNGQIPHVDFFTPMGPVTFLIVAFGMRLGGACVSSIAYANAVFLVVFSLWAWAVARTRVTAALSFLFSLYVGFMVAASSVYGHSFKGLGYSAMYNRYGVALTALVFLEALGCPRHQFRPWSYVIQGVSTGLALAITFFLKLNFFGVAFLGIMAGAILAPQSRHRWIGLCAGALAVSLMMLAYLRFDVAAFYHNMSMAGRLRGVGFLRNAFGMLTDPAVFSSVFLMATLWCIAPVPDGYYRSWMSPRWGQGLLVLFLVLAQALLSLTNTQPPLPTLFPVASLLILEAARRAVSQRQVADPETLMRGSPGWLATLLLALYFVASILVPDMESLPYSAFIRAVGARGVTVTENFSSLPMADMLAPRDPDYVRIVNDGCQLLQAHSRPSDRIVTMDLCNPFSFALQRVPPTGDAIYWNQQTFSRNVHLDPKRVFDQASIVMVPKKPIESRPEHQPMDVYAGFIDAHYTLGAESTFWRLYQRRSN
jgi:hypothetical protein